MKNKIGYQHYLIINLLVGLSIVGCNNIMPSITPKSTGTIAIPTRSGTTMPTIMPTFTAYPSTTPVVTYPTISSRSPAFKAWLTWKTNFIEGIAWSPNSKQVATVAGDALNDRSVHLIDLSILHGNRFSEDAPGPAITFSPNGEELVVGSLGLEVWKISDKTLLGFTRTSYSSFVTYLPGKNDSFIVALAFPDNSSIETVSLKSVNSTWEFQPFLNIKGYLRDISLSDDGTLLATATKYFDNSTDDGEHILVWDLTSKKQICSIHGLGVAFSTMDTLGTAASDGISLWNAKTCQLIKSFPPGPGYPARYPYNITFSPDGKLLALALDGNVVQILDADSGEVVQELNVVFDYANYIRFSPDGRFLATISRNEDSPEIETILIIWKVADNSQELIEISPEFFEPAN